MLIINNEQLNAFQEDRVRQLREWLLPHVRKHFTLQVAGMDDDDLAGLIGESVARARSLGASESENVCQFVHLKVLFGEGLEGLPWAAGPLADKELSGDAKINLLAQHARIALRTGGPA